MDVLKPILLVLLGLVVILGYAATMVFGLEFVYWIALALIPIFSIQLYRWTS